MNTYLIYNTSDTRRVRWVYDEYYETQGSYWLGTEEETREAEDAEIAKLESGEWVALGCIVETKCVHCGAWSEADSLWGIVIGPDIEELKEFERCHMVQDESRG
jgi:hypothetical protein